MVQIHSPGPFFSGSSPDTRVTERTGHIGDNLAVQACSRLRQYRANPYQQRSTAAPRT